MVDDAAKIRLGIARTERHIKRYGATMLAIRAIDALYVRAKWHLRQQAEDDFSHWTTWDEILWEVHAAADKWEAARDPEGHYAKF